MSDDNYWKDRYKDFWGAGADKEKAVAKRVEDDTGLKVELVGFGAGSSEYLPGKASSHDHEKGSADLHVVGTNVYLEVTGPFSKFVKEAEPIWVRPDKIENAKTHASQNKTVVVHVLASNGLMRVISLNEDFLARYDQGEFPVVEPTIRGTKETYISIPANHEVVRTWSDFVGYLAGL